MHGSSLFITSTDVFLGFTSKMLRFHFLFEYKLLKYLKLRTEGTRYLSVLEDSFFYYYILLILFMLEQEVPKTDRVLLK